MAKPNLFRSDLMPKPSAQKLDSAGRPMSGRAYWRQLRAVETHRLEIIAAMKISGLSDGLTINPEIASAELTRRKEVQNA